MCVSLSLSLPVPYLRKSLYGPLWALLEDTWGLIQNGVRIVVEEGTVL